VLRPSEEWCITTCVAGTSIGYHVSVTALQMAVAYATIANDGLWVQPSLFLGATAADGTGIPAAPPGTTRIVSSNASRAKGSTAV
jgi:cell division protein FtsI (penicillin-binding protein 3)